MYDTCLWTVENLIYKWSPLLIQSKPSLTVDMLVAKPKLKAHLVLPALLRYCDMYDKVNEPQLSQKPNAGSSNSSAAAASKAAATGSAASISKGVKETKVVTHYAIVYLQSYFHHCQEQATISYSEDNTNIFIRSGSDASLYHSYIYMLCKYDQSDETNLLAALQLEIDVVSAHSYHISPIITSQYLSFTCCTVCALCVCVHAEMRFRECTMFTSRVLFACTNSLLQRDCHTFDCLHKPTFFEYNAIRSLHFITRDLLTRELLLRAPLQSHYFCADERATAPPAHPTKWLHRLRLRPKAVPELQEKERDRVFVYVDQSIGGSSGGCTDHRHRLRQGLLTCSIVTVHMRKISSLVRTAFFCVRPSQSATLTMPHAKRCGWRLLST